MSRPPWTLTKSVPPFFGCGGALDASARSHAATVPRLARTRPLAKSRRAAQKRRCVLARDGLRNPCMRILILAGGGRPEGRHTHRERAATVRSVPRSGGGRNI